MTAFVTVFVLAIVLVAGLVLDGGMIFAAYVRAVNEAQSAARAGAQQLDLGVYRDSNRVILDATRARGAALGYLAETPDTGTATVSGDTVSVNVRAVQETVLLQIAGLGSVEVVGTASAQAQRGVESVQ